MADDGKKPIIIVLGKNSFQVSRLSKTLSESSGRPLISVDTLSQDGPLSLPGSTSSIFNNTSDTSSDLLNRTKPATALEVQSQNEMLIADTAKPMTALDHARTDMDEQFLKLQSSRNSAIFNSSLIMSDSATLSPENFVAAITVALFDFSSRLGSRVVHQGKTENYCDHLYFAK
jgi:hypothetical protein